ncbi:hypothetical protein PIB30_076789 [Stylosanthes scabra]|uniref:Aminotransferase-like plant mobile domain-containing protein n=1 Tax=Stylosanthes scabra TaxID=79078 RepID=A0ABU6YQY4_9FABA|nr:hypothetical protein [Stylosanthes scabra]
MDTRRLMIEPYLKRSVLYHELLGAVPSGHVGTTKFNIKLKWLRSRLQEMPLDISEHTLMQYARCYIMYLLGGVLFPDKANNAVHSNVSFNRMGHRGYARMSHAAYVMDILQTVVVAPRVTTHTFPLATRGKNDYNDARLLRYCERLNALNLEDVNIRFSEGQPHGDFYTAVMPLIFFKLIEVLNVNRVLRQFEGKQYPPNPPLNIDVFHKQSARKNDGWWPTRLAEWFAVWNNRRSDARRLVIVPATTFYPSRQYFEWYWDRAKRFLSMPVGFHDPRDVELPPEAPDEHGSPPVVAWPDVPIDRRHLSTRVRRARRVFQQDEAPPQPPSQPVQEEAAYFPNPQYYYPQPFDAPVPPHQPMFHFLEGASSYEIGSSSQVQDEAKCIERQRVSRVKEEETLYTHPTSIPDNFCSGAPIVAPFATTRSSSLSLRFYPINLEFSSLCS